MTNKTLLAILWISSILFLAGTIFFFCCQFGSTSLSNDPAQWGQFGDYLGGLLNPFFSLLNLVILTYLSIRLVKEDNDRNEFTIRELVRPFGQVHFTEKDEAITIELNNCGMGPLLITSMRLRNTKGGLINFQEFIDRFSSKGTFRYQTLQLKTDCCAIAKDKGVVLLSVSGDLTNSNFTNCFTEMKARINEYELEITYSDMYKRPIDKIIEKVEFD